MKAVFYDRKNKREVTSEQLMSANLIEEYLVVDSDGCAPGTKYTPDTFDTYLAERKLGELAYKSEKCSSPYNWDLWTSTSELVFLRLEE